MTANITSELFLYHPEVFDALKSGLPVLAVESSIIAQGMPFPENIAFHKKAVLTVRNEGVVPATIALSEGKVHIGLTKNLLGRTCLGKSVEKVTLRDIGTVLSKGSVGATTVSSALFLANKAGINVFATGGIGGVHRNAGDTFDISQDIIALAQTPGIVVSAGAKAILDIPKTVEHLETMAVAIVGYKCNEFPAFYSRRSGCYLESTADSPKEIAQIFNLQTKLGIKSSLLVVNPIPSVEEISRAEILTLVNRFLAACKEQNITGKEVTPFLLKSINKATGGLAQNANVALALNNIRLGAQIAQAVQANKC